MKPFGDDDGNLNPRFANFLFAMFPLSWFGPLGFFLNAGLYIAGLITLLIVFI